MVTPTSDHEARDGLVPPKTGTCPSVPLGPGKDVLMSNINLAEQASQMFDAQPNGNLMKIRWDYDSVRTALDRSSIWRSALGLATDRCWIQVYVRVPQGGC
jgi:hypothetical protein